MSSVYPGALDTFATNKANATLTEDDHPAHHNDLADAINKIEAELGANPSGALATLVLRLAAIEAASYPPNGAAGGDLSGSYPNPQIGSGVIVNADINAAAGIAKTKLAALAIVNADVDPAAAIAYSKLNLTSGIVNGDVNAAAAIAESKLNLATDAAAGTGSRRTIGTGALQAMAGNTPYTDKTLLDAKGDLFVASAADTPAKLTVGADSEILIADSTAPNGIKWGASLGGPPSGAAGGDLSGTYPNPQILAGAIVNADVNAAAAIAYSKLSLTASIVNADIAAAAAIAESKLNLATDAAAGTGSRRTLGTGSTQAAAGDHTHAALYQPLDSDLTAIAALTTTAFGRSLLADADAIAHQKTSAVVTVSSLPGAPVDGQECYYLADATNGVVWHLKYRSGSASAFKWEFIGGVPLYAEVLTASTRANAAYGDPTVGTVGPSVTVPLQGDYVIVGSAVTDITATGVSTLVAAIKLGAAATSDNETIGRLARQSSAAASTTDVMGSATLIRTGLAASAVLNMQYKVSAGTGQWSNRTLAVYPRRVI